MRTYGLVVRALKLYPRGVIKFPLRSNFCMFEEYLNLIELNLIYLIKIDLYNENITSVKFQRENWLSLHSHFEKMKISDYINTVRGQSFDHGINKITY